LDLGRRNGEQEIERGIPGSLASFHEFIEPGGQKSLNPPSIVKLKFVWMFTSAKEAVHSLVVFHESRLSVESKNVMASAR
jgi:hypothetical protein